MNQILRVGIIGAGTISAYHMNGYKALPNTEISTIGQSSTGRGWRKHSHYYTLKRMYDEGKYIPFDE